MVNTRQSTYENESPLHSNQNPEKPSDTNLNPQNDPAVILVQQPSTTQPDYNQQQLVAILAQLNFMNSEINNLKKGKAPLMDQGELSHYNKDLFGEQDEMDMDNFSWNRNTNRRPYSKVEFPKYEGGDPRGWILKAEKYFRYYRTPEDLKVDVAAINLDGDALDTFTWVSSGRTTRHWEELVQVFQEQFGPAEFQNPDVHLCGIKQTGTVAEYKQEFIRRQAQVQGWPEHCLLGVFINGLKEEFQADVKIQKPRTVYKAVSLAVEFEAKMQSQGSQRFQSRFNPDVRYNVAPFS